jgi:hypothetical protein
MLGLSSCMAADERNLKRFWQFLFEVRAKRSGDLCPEDDGAGRILCDGTGPRSLSNFIWPSYRMVDRRAQNQNPYT